MHAYAGRDTQPDERAQEFQSRGFGCLPCFWILDTVCDECSETVRNVAQLAKHNPEPGQWVSLPDVDVNELLPEYQGRALELNREAELKA